MRSTDDLRELLKFITEGTLVLFDIDDTLFISSSDYGSQEWLNRNTPKKEDVGEDRCNQSYREIRDFKNARIEPCLQYRPVQPDLLEVLKAIRDKGAHIMCLTARNPSEERVLATEKTLRALGILPYLSSTTIPTETLEFEQPIKVRNGVIYANNFNKKDQVYAKVSTLLTTYSNVLFAEDSPEVAERFQKQHPKSKVFHYTRKEFFTSAYSSELVEFQEQELKRTQALGEPKVPTNIESRIALFDKKFQQLISRRVAPSTTLALK